jgi:F-type H+-transporting ATPase subunit b
MDLITPGIGLVFWMLLSFLTVLFILTKFGWKPILGALKEREKSIDNALRSAEKAKEEMAKLQADNQKILAEAKIERDSLLKEAREVKDKIIAEAKNEASLEAKKLIDSARQNIQNEKAEAINEIKNQIATFSVEIAEKLLRQKLADNKSQSELIDGVLKDIKLN